MRKSSYKYLAFAVIALGTFNSVVDHGSVVIALPAIADRFETDLPTLQWVIVGYALTISAVLLPMGRLSDIVGRKQMYLTGFAIFILGAGIAGASTNMLTLVLSRVLQGCGAAMTQSTATAMIISIFPASERGKALGMHMSTVGVGLIVGPALGGLLVHILDWRWVFLIQVPAGLVAIALALYVLDQRMFGQDGGRPKFDWPGTMLSAGALVSLMLALTMAPRTGWTSPPILAAELVFIAALGGFIWWELRTRSPMLDLGLFRHRTFARGVSAGYISFLAIPAVVFMVPIYLQSVLAYSPGTVGLLMVPNAIALIFLGPVMGRLSDRYGWRRFLIGGMALSACGVFLLSRVTDHSPLALVMAGMILQSFGIGIFHTPNQSALLSSVEQNKFGVVSAFTQLLRNSANVLGIAIATAIITATMAGMGHPPTSRPSPKPIGEKRCSRPLQRGYVPLI